MFAWGTHKRTEAYEIRHLAEKKIQEAANQGFGELFVSVYKIMSDKKK